MTIARFGTTRWSVVAAAAGDSSSLSHDALSSLCSAYWPPLYSYVRGRGYSEEESQDLVQEFFARLLEQRIVQHAREERGRFRSFLLAAFKNFLSNEWDKTRAQKRGQGALHLSMDFESAPALASGQLTPDQVYDRQWALTLLEQVMETLRNEYAQRGMTPHFDTLRQTLQGGDTKSRYRDYAQCLGVSEGSIKTAVHRLRKRYRSLLKQHVADIVADQEQIDSELQYLLEALGH